LRGTDLSAEEGGTVAEIPCDKGARIKKGDTLLLLDRRLLEAEMHSALANLDLATYNADRMRQLFEANSVSQIELLDAQTRESQARAAADAARIRYDRAAISAPFDGLVALGQLVAPGMPVARIVDPYVLKLEGSVTEQEVRSIYQGETATVWFEGVEEPVEGRVHVVGFEANPATGKFPVEIRVSNPDLRVRPGVVGRGRVLKTTHEGVLAVPRDAVLLVGGAPVAYVVEGDRARRRDLTLGASQGLMVIVEQGLATGERLVVRGQRELRDGTLVAVQEVATSPDGTMPGDPQVVTQTQALTDGPIDNAGR
jgi:membrane fusion protein (multidrug efflux system)